MFHLDLEIIKLACHTTPAAAAASHFAFGSNRIHPTINAHHKWNVCVCVDVEKLFIVSTTYS